MEDELLRELLDFFSQFKPLRYRKSELIFRQNEHIGEVAFISNGLVKLYSLSTDGRESVINLFKPVFPISYIYSAEKRATEYNLEALTEAELWKCPRETFDAFVSNGNKISEYLASYFSHICMLLIDNVSGVLSGNSTNRISRTLVLLSKNIGIRGNGSTRIGLATTHSLLASMTGLTRETVSIQIKKLESKGLIDIERSSIIVKDMEKLLDITI